MDRWLHRSYPLPRSWLPRKEGTVAPMHIHGLDPRLARRVDSGAPGAPLCGVCSPGCEENGRSDKPQRNNELGECARTHRELTFLPFLNRLAVPRAVPTAPILVNILINFKNVFTYGRDY